MEAMVVEEGVSEPQESEVVYNLQCSQFRRSQLNTRNDRFHSKREHHNLHNGRLEESKI